MAAIIENSRARLVQELQEQGEFEQAKRGGYYDSTELEETYQLGKNRKIQPDYTQPLGGGYFLLVNQAEQQAVIVDRQGNEWELWGDPHVTYSRNGEFVDAFDFINNISIQLPNHTKVTFVTTTHTENGMTLLDEVVVFDPSDEGTATSYKMASDDEPVRVQGKAAYDMENTINDGGIIDVNTDLSDVTFYHENGDTAVDVWQGENDTTADFAKVKGVRNEVIELDTQTIFDDLGADIDLITDREDVAFSIILFLVFQARQNGIQNLMRIRLSDLDSNNADINKINALLNSVQAALEGDGEDPVNVPASAYDFLVSKGVLDPQDPNINEHIKYNESTNSYDIKGAVLKQSLTSKAEQLQNLSQQMQQETQFSFSNMTSSAEALTSSLRGFFEMLKNVSRNIGSS